MSHEHDQICPFCFTIFPPGVWDPDVPVCRECNAFGRAIILEDYTEFVANTSISRVEAIRQNWAARENFLEDEREMILRNIDSFLSGLKPE